jgi:hypothetical protein
MSEQRVSTDESMRERGPSGPVRSTESGLS